MPYVDVFKLMEFANNMADKTIDANDIARFPWADVVEVKHGKWTKIGDRAYRCSVCNRVSCCMSDYCPDCGAKMQKERR